jgi:hypothetical protein
MPKLCLFNHIGFIRQDGCLTIFWQPIFFGQINSSDQMLLVTQIFCH